MIKFNPTNKAIRSDLNTSVSVYGKNINNNTSVRSTKQTVSIVEKVLGNNSILTNAYIKDNILLTKSITIKNDNEASSYNTYISLKYPTHKIDLSDKTTWRYYKHLAGEYHELDTPITLTSLDNGSVIVLNRDTLNIHLRTKAELLKFSLFYKELVDKYPEQELFIKSVLGYSRYSTINDIIDLQDFTIVSYNDSYIEENESDLIYELQESIDNYKNIRLIQYYSLSDNLFMASQYHILYNFILTKLLAIRLKNAKTLKAHTYHIKNYLASHHFLDNYFRYLTKKQYMFLYKNLLYLNNHSGRNSVFKILIDKLFTERRISIVNYRYKQINDTDEQNYIKYKFSYHLLNNSDLVYPLTDRDLKFIKNEEYKLTEGNSKEWDYGFNKIDTKFKNSLFNLLITKDLETTVIDSTDTVRYKFIPTLIDYWAYLLKTNRINFIVNIIDPVSNKELSLNTKDLFKLFIIILYKINNIQLANFPDYTIKRIYRETLPDNNYLLSLCFNKYYWYNDVLNTVKSNIPRYDYIFTSNQFENYISTIYKGNIGLWLLTSNYSDLTDNGQFELLIDRLHTTDTYSFNDETVDNFINRINLENLMNYNTNILDTLMYNILNSIYNNNLGFLNEYKYIQQALIEVFKKFNSYSVQIIDNYYNSSPVLAGSKDTRYYVSQSATSKFYHYDFYILNADMNYKIKDTNIVEFKETSYHNYNYKSNYNLNIGIFTNIDYNIFNNVSVLFNNRIINDLGTNNWLVIQSSDDQLEFLAMNL